MLLDATVDGTMMVVQKKISKEYFFGNLLPKNYFAENSEAKVNM